MRTDDPAFRTLMQRCINNQLASKALPYVFDTEAPQVQVTIDVGRLCILGNFDNELMRKLKNRCEQVALGRVMGDKTVHLVKAELNHMLGRMFERGALIQDYFTGDWFEISKEKA